MNRSSTVSLTNGLFHSNKADLVSETLQHDDDERRRGVFNLSWHQFVLLIHTNVLFSVWFLKQLLSKIVVATFISVPGAICCAMLPSRKSRFVATVLHLGLPGFPTILVVPLMSMRTRARRPMVSREQSH
jgi:hypothetical protein